MRKDLQSYFNTFHEKVKLNDTEDNKVLRDKRDMLVREIRAYLKKKSEDEEKSLITFSIENQGSYSMGTGIKPLDGDYDIDVMLLFNISKDEYEPVEVKEWVFDALNNQANRTVAIRRPCVTVQYKKNGEDQYHVDFAVYSDRESNSNKKTYLAKGFSGSDKNNKLWEESNPKKLKKVVNDKFTNQDERHQFKRIIRYLKRWKDENFSTDGNSAPTGISITALALDHFKPQTSNSFNDEIEINDFKALKEFVDSIINSFWFNSISVNLPVEPYNNLFEKMSSKQMKNFKEKLKELKDVLKDANDEPDAVEACKLIKAKLGSDFPVPTKEKSAEKKNRGFSTSSESA